MTTYQAQCLLGYLGYDPGGVDGAAGPRTRGALQAFQAASGLPQLGTADEDTCKALVEAVAGDKFRNRSFWADIRYFNRREFRCPCPRCGGFPAEPAESLVRIAESLRSQAGAPMVITSGVRCKSHNAEVGGVANSRHLLGHAMDFRILGRNAQQSLELVRRQPGVAYAYAIDEMHVHADIGG